jgi:glycosyltransferase involved in cell wall biosynthesis
MSCRLVVITEIIAPYRIPVFNSLAQQPGIGLQVLFLAENDPTQRQWPVYKDEMRFDYEVLPSWRRRIGGHNLLLNWRIDRTLRRMSPDTIICGGYNYIASWKSLDWARRHRVPFLLWAESTVRNFRKGSALVESLKTKFLRHCDGFVVPGKSSLEYLSSYGTREEVIFTAPNAVDIEFFAQRSAMVRTQDSAYRRAMRLPSRFFLFVGRLVSAKGIFDLLAAYASLPAELRREVGLVFAGDGQLRSQLEEQAAAIVPGTVQIGGFAPREDLAIYYALAEAMVFPTHTDAWGLVVNEAMACGLPVICSSAAGCAADLVNDGENGRVVPAGDVSQLAFAMEQLAGDHELRSQMGRHSRGKIQQYSPEACAAGMAKAAIARVSAR